jgi:PAS domain S-box-containing protein
MATSNTQSSAGNLAQRETLAGIISSAMDAIISIDEEQRVTLFNAAAERMFQCSSADAIGSPLDRFIPERYRAAHRHHVVSFSRTGTTTREMGRLGIVLGVRADGTEFPLEATISKVEAGGKHFMSAIIRDITERKRTEQEREQLQAKVLHQEKLAAIGLLSSGLAHEIGNPLASIQAICENLARKSSEPATVEKCQRIREQVRRITDIVGSLVNFARPGQAAWKAVDINATLEAAMSIAKLSRTAKSIEIALKFDQALPHTIAIADQLSQVFLNLFLNAIDASKEAGGKIIVSSKQVSAETIEISVSDNGHGISGDDMPKLFTPFFTTKEVGKGTGLGLHVCDGIIKRHGGEIRVASNPDTGSTFTILLPIRKQPPEGSLSA